MTTDAKTLGVPLRSLRFELPIRLVNPTNGREHWAVRARRVKRERACVAMAWRSARHGVTITLPVTVYLTRIGPRVMDSDGSIASLKGVRDQVAAELGVDDGDPRVRWEYGQRGGAYGVEVVAISEEVPL